MRGGPARQALCRLQGVTGLSPKGSPKASSLQLLLGCVDALRPSLAWALREKSFWKQPLKIQSGLCLGTINTLMGFSECQFSQLILVLKPTYRLS